MSTFANPLTEYSPQLEAFEFSSEIELSQESGAVFNEAQEGELASQFLEIANEQELEDFLGDLIKKAGSALKSPIGQAIGGVLKTVAKQALPIAGGALGGFVGGPLGASLGSSLASMAGNALGLELEGLSPEDREFEASKQFVKFAGQTVKNALEAPPNADPATAARSAAVQAARMFAPGLMDTSKAATAGSETKDGIGRWVRHSGKIILFGV